MAELADSRARHHRHTRRDGEVQDGLPQGDGLTLRGILRRRRAPARAHYGWTQFLGDCSGGVIAALIALPYGLAMASLMGLPPVLGVFTSILTAPVIAIFGRNPVLIGGTASATVPFIALAARQGGIPAAATLCVLASLIMIGFSLIRLGRHIMR